MKLAPRILALAILVADLFAVPACPRISGVPVLGPGVDCATDAVASHVDLLTEVTTVLTNPSFDAVVSRLGELVRQYGPEVIACWVDKVTGDSQAQRDVSSNLNADLRARNGAEWLRESKVGFARRIR